MFTLFLIDVRLHTALSQMDNFMPLCQNLEMCMHRSRLPMYMSSLHFLKIGAVKSILYIGVCMKFAQFSTFFIQPG
jgi:hypothetical protein